MPKKKAKRGRKRAEPVQCDVVDDGKRCPTIVVNGKSGAKGKCWMHYQRERRGIGDMRLGALRGDRTARIDVWMTEAQKERIQALAKNLGHSVSEWSGLALAAELTKAEKRASTTVERARATAQA